MMMSQEGVVAAIVARARHEVATQYEVAGAAHQQGHGSELLATCVQIRVERGRVTGVVIGERTHDCVHPVLDFVRQACAVHPRAGEITCDVCIGLHDAYAPGPDTEGLLVFARHEDARGQVAIPDLYAMRGYGGKLALVDPTPVDDPRKRRLALFVGASTGHCDPQRNARLRFCDWAHREGSDVAHALIWPVTQMPLEAVQRAYPDTWPGFVARGSVPIWDQTQHYRYLVSLDGNTSAWDRLPWIMAANCVALKQRSPNMLWYYPLMRPGRHFLEFEDPAEVRQLVAATPDQAAKDVVCEAHAFVRDFLSPAAHLLYMGEVLLAVGLKQRQ